MNRCESTRFPLCNAPVRGQSFFSDFGKTWMSTCSNGHTQTSDIENRITLKERLQPGHRSKKSMSFVARAAVDRGQEVPEMLIELALRFENRADAEAEMGLKKGTECLSKYIWKRGLTWSGLRDIAKRI